jgi:hypothetical protein
LQGGAISSSNRLRQGEIEQFSAPVFDPLVWRERRGLGGEERGLRTRRGLELFAFRRGWQFGYGRGSPLRTAESSAARSRSVARRQWLDLRQAGTLDVDGEFKLVFAAPR